MRTGALVAFVAVAIVAEVRPGAQQPRASQTGATSSALAAAIVLTPTPHPPMPRDASSIWLLPDRTAAGPVANPGLLAVTSLMAEGSYSKALTAATQPALRQGSLAAYASYYSGLAQLRLEKPADALRTFQTMLSQGPVGYLSEAAQFGAADAWIALDQPSEAIEIYERLLAGKPSSFEEVLMRLGRAAKAKGDRAKAAEAFARVYYEFALGESAPAAGTEIALLRVRDVQPGSQRYQLELGRAQRLYAAKQYAAARSAFDDLKGLADGDDRELIRLRVAECDYFLKKHRVARDALKPLTEGSGDRLAEARYFHALASRDLGDAASYLNLTQRLVADFPDSAWTEEALNSLGTYYIRQDDDAQADAAFRDMYARFPTGPYAERAAWKIGWRAYRAAQYEEAIRFFESGALNFPRSDYRPSWLYWAARAHENLSEKSLANQRYAIVVADYMNSYYGRLSAAKLGAMADTLARAASSSIVNGDTHLPPEAPANAAIIKALLAAGLWDDALNELKFARRVWGDSPSIQATVAWTQQQQSRAESGMRRLLMMRAGMNAMRRAYPQFMTADGQTLPRDVLAVIYPLEHWPLIQRYAALNELDPYLVAALVAQESTFVADVRSHANAWGLMQLLPSTARAYARKLGIRYSSSILTDPETNIRMGTAYLADKIKEFGDVRLALASYNAGESPVRRWLGERGGIDRDEFVDDIPYPETQGYVRKIIGTAEDYRYLYSAAGKMLDSTPVAPAVILAPPAARPPAARASRPSPKPKPHPTPTAKKRPSKA